MVLLTFLYAAGFLVQMLPCAFYCLYPFWDSFRFSRRRVLLSIIFIIMILDVLFVWLGLFPPKPLQDQTAVLPESVFYLSLAALLGIYLVLIDAPVQHKLFTFFVSMNYGFFLTEIVSFLCEAFSLEYAANDICSLPGLLFHLLLNGILLYPMLHLMQHIQQTFQFSAPKGIWKKLTLIPAGLILLLCFTCRLPLYADIRSSITLELVTKSMELFMLFLYYWIFQVMKQSQQQDKERSRLEAMVDNYRTLAQTSGQLHEMRHEIMHHIHALSILMEQQDYEDAKSYLASVDQMAALIPPLSYTAHPLLDSMLTDYKRRAEEAGIDILYQIYVPRPPMIENVDLCQLLTNLMDNALEGCSHVEPGKRRLSLTIKQSGTFLFFSCENTCDGSRLVFRDGFPIPAELSDETHGHGIPLMQRICEKYTGVFKTCAAGDFFKVSVNLCLAENKRKRKENN